MARTDKEKLQACLEAVLKLAVGEGSAYKSVSAELRQRLGPGWTGVAAMQWLTGKTAWSLIEAIPVPTTGKDPKALAMALVDFSARVCQETGVGGNAEVALERIKAAGGLERLH